MIKCLLAYFCDKISDYYIRKRSHFRKRRVVTITYFVTPKVSS